MGGGVEGAIEREETYGTDEGKPVSVTLNLSSHWGSAPVDAILPLILTNNYHIIQGVMRVYEAI